MKKMVSIILIITLSMALYACGTDDITDQIVNVAQAEDEHVLAVKSGTPNDYPEKTYGETFDDFFGSPTWKYFVGTKEGADEDGDGEQDYTEENIEIVEFTGYCTYQGVKVKALIQFTLSKAGDTFEATYLSFNDVPQNMFMLSALLEAAFTGDEIDDGAVNNTDDDDVNNRNNDAVDNTDDAIDENALLEEFITLICSYNDPPDLEGDALQEYFKREFDSWVNGEGYTNITTDADGHLIIPDHTVEYIGMWLDINSQRCNMEISSSDGIYYNIDINWGSSASENTHWSFGGIYDEETGGIHYYGSRIEEYYPDDGDVQETYVYSDGEGFIWIGDDGILCWDDYTEQQGADCSFQRSE